MPSPQNALNIDSLRSSPYPRDQLKVILHDRMFEGVPIRPLNRELDVGDTYLAARNTGPHLLTAKKIVTEPNSLAGGFVIPEENAYAFDVAECVPIEILLEG